MPLLFDEATSRESHTALRLKDYTSVLDRYGDRLDEAHLIDSAPLFLDLISNPHFLEDVLVDELERLADIDDFQMDNPYRGQLFALHATPQYLVRAVIWAPPSQQTEVKTHHDKQFGFLAPHDHNYTLLTGSYIGPGYHTETFEYDVGSSLLVAGSPVSIIPTGTYKFVHGRAMLYRESRDIHIQHYPDSLSLSINVLLPSKMKQKQAYFDIEGARVRGLVSEGRRARATLCSLARHFDNDDVRTLLSSVVGSDAPIDERVAAHESLSALRGE
jgi:hypothetical protein